MLGLKESLDPVVIAALLRFDPRQLGRLLNAKGTGQCPRHPGTEGLMAVHEYGVQFPCGCCRRLPPLHSHERTWAACKLCCSNVVPLHKGPRRLSSEEIEELRRQVGVL